MRCEVGVPSSTSMSDQLVASRPQDIATLGAVPSEILQQIFYYSTTPTFFQLIQVTRRFFQLASQSREVILHHLRYVPGLKVGLEDRSIPTEHLFLIFRQRAASHLYGVNFTADCRSWGIPSNRSGGSIDPRASCLGVESEWGNNVCLVLKNSLRIRLNWQNDLPGESIESPYADGRAKIIQAVQKSHYITVLYAWTPPEDDPAHDTSHPESTPVKDSVKEVLEGQLARHRSPRYDRASPSKQNNQSKASSSSQPRSRYHLLHYDMFRNDRPVFFPVPTHKSINDNILVPVHLAVHSRLECAILWDLPDTLAPSLDATVCLYTADHLPRYEQGEYNVCVLYPYDRPSAIYRSRSGDRIDFGRENSDDDIDGSGITYTVTSVREKFNRSGYNVGQDLRLVYFPLRPRAISFFKNGRRLSLYAPGSSVPFTTLLANEAVRSRVFSPVMSPVNFPSHSHSLNALRRRIRQTNNTSIYGAHFALGLPFFSTHETTGWPDIADVDLMVPDAECVSHTLCVGTARLPSTRWHRSSGLLRTGPWVLTIVQIRKRVLYDLCPHSRPIDDLPALPRPPRDYRRRRHSNVLLYPSDGPHADITAAPDVGDNDDDIDNNNDNVDNDSELDADVISEADVDDTDVDALRGTDLRVAARLWGWSPQHTTLTGLDTVCVSPRGERIAVAQWDRVLVYALDPRALCDETWDDDSDFGDAISEEESSSESGSESEHDDNDTGVADDMAVGDQNGVPGDDTGNNSHGNGTQNPLSTSEPPPSAANPVQVPSVPIPPKAAASVASSTSTSLSDLLFFYPHTRDGWPLERIVELRPLVLKMDGGAVVRKMSWALGKLPRADEECTNNAGDIYGKGEEAEGAADEKGGVVKEKEKEDDDGIYQQDRPQPSGLPQSYDQSSPRPNLPAEALSENTYTEVQKQEPSMSFHEIPPAPFSDTKLIGQIRHIARPPDYHSSASKVVLESPEPSPPSLAELDVAKGKENELMETSTAGRRDESHDTSTGQERGMSPAPELSESGESEPWDKRKRPPRRRVAENELVVLTDRGLQVWDLSVWGRGRRIRRELPRDDILH
ncbi:uncharacterized protein PV07_03641 [Cladophialophora immunda]|uniref:F-box domain-containing protein n=1 Tax=Cladophialophora immunda TaxID=569365 RepID=A0A0D2B366_9EURO|nr:uncharacterized protein PV07_03641 [Cladophialophora immunda]KIW32067.1 hypothetical protein PV07_03641 [Cladophialophora immunda]